MDASRHVSRSAGQSAIAAAAYRAGAKLFDERTEQLHDYTRRYGVVATGLTMPERGGPGWTREELWNAAEAAERRKDARVARKIEVALPGEMTPEERQELVVTWARAIAERYGVAVDWAIHLPDQEGDKRNHHAHLMVTTREIGPEGFRGKAALELSNADQKKRGLAVGDDGIYALRALLAERLNEVAERHGLELTADPRSYAARGIELAPTKHVGVHAVGMNRRGLEAERVDEHAEARAENARRILERPEVVLETLTRTEAVFTRHDMARALNRYLDDPEQFRDALVKLEASPELERLTEGRAGEPARFSTREMIAAEEKMMEAAAALAASGTHRVTTASAERAEARHPTLSEEQRAAVEHVTAPGRLAVVAGAAGAGKSAALATAREAWEAEGYRVRGAALAGKAAEELQAAAGIESRTLHALEYGWRRGRDPLAARDVLVIDEGGMVGSRQLGRVLEAAQGAGAKVVLVGDARQLQPIEAGAAFRAVAEQVGVVEIGTIRRQREAWAREASQAFARGETGAGLEAYAAHGAVHWLPSREAAKAAIAEAYVAAGMSHPGRMSHPGGVSHPGRTGRPGGGGLILAHTNEDVRDLNALVRTARQRTGALGVESPFATARGERWFAPEDRVVFLRNDRALGVKNGTLGTVAEAAPGALTVRLDSGAEVRVGQGQYAELDHGYAVTLHKAQGTTVERAFVLASGGMDRHLAYVGMTRHREAAGLYAGRDDFPSQAALVRRLSRERAKQSTLDFAERRGVETPKAWLENTWAWLDRGRERLAEAWGRAERVFAAVRGRFTSQARPGPAARAASAARLAPTMEQSRPVTDQGISRTPEAAEAERQQALREAFRSGPEASEAKTQRAHEARLREQFGQRHAAGAEQDPAARQRALRESFSDQTPQSGKTPEELRRAFKDRDNPVPEQNRNRNGNSTNRERGRESGQGRER